MPPRRQANLARRAGTDVRPLGRCAQGNGAAAGADRISSTRNAPSRCGLTEALLGRDVSLAYSALISRDRPACLIFLLDQSESMALPFGVDQTTRRADCVADVVNRTLQKLVIRCAKTEEVRNYYYVSVIRYGGRVEPAFGGVLSGRTLAPISEVAEYPA